MNKLIIVVMAVVAIAVPAVAQQMLMEDDIIAMSSVKPLPTMSPDVSKETPVATPSMEPVITSSAPLEVATLPEAPKTEPVTTSSAPPKAEQVATPSEPAVVEQIVFIQTKMDKNYQVIVEEVGGASSSAEVPCNPRIKPYGYTGYDYIELRAKIKDLKSGKVFEVPAEKFTSGSWLWVIEAPQKTGFLGLGGTEIQSRRTQDLSSLPPYKGKKM